MQTDDRQHGHANEDPVGGQQGQRRPPAKRRRVEWVADSSIWSGGDEMVILAQLQLG